MSASTEANMDHDPKRKSKMKNRAEKSKTEAEDAKASQQEVATIQLIRLEELEKLREDLISIVEHFIEDNFQALDRFIEDFMEDSVQAVNRLIEDCIGNDGDATEKDGDARESDRDATESDGDATESEFSESEPEMLPEQTFPEKEPVASSADIEQTARPERTQAVHPERKVVTLSEGNQTVAPEGKPSASEEPEQDSDPEIGPQTPQDRKGSVSHDSQDLRKDKGTQTESAEDAPARGLLRIPLRRTLRALGRRLQEAPGEE